MVIVQAVCHSLQKHVLAIYREFLKCKKMKILMEKKIDIFYIFAQNIQCAYILEPLCKGGSNEYPQCIFWVKNKKIRYTLQTPVFLYKSGVYVGIHFTDMLS